MVDNRTMMKYSRILLFFLFWVATSVVAQRKLFPAESYQSDQGYVYEFIDRYFNELENITNYSDILQKLTDDKVYFAQGSVSDISKLSESIPFMLNRIEDKYFEATWKEGETVDITVLFPVSFELLWGHTKAEIEKNIEYEIKNSKRKEGTITVVPDDMLPLNDSVYRTNPKQHYELESLNNCCYYQLDSTGIFNLIMDQNEMEFSVLNLMHYCQDADYTIDVEQSVYGFNQLHFNMQLRQWLIYCQDKGMTIFAAIEEELTDVLKVLVVAECKELAFNHLLSVYVPKDCLYNTSKSWKAQLNAYIPTHNVKNLYQQYQKRAKRDIVL